MADVAPPPALSSSKIDEVKNSSQSIRRVLGVPLINESLTFATNTINQYSILATPYHLTGSLLDSSLKAAQPITSRLHPQLALVDAWGAKAFDFAESHVPYPFHVTTEEVYKQALAAPHEIATRLRSMPGDAHRAYETRVYAPAKNVYDERIVPAYAQAKKENAVFQRAAEVVEQLQAKLSSTLETVRSRGKQDGDEASRKAENIASSLMGELERVRNFIGSVPAASQQRVQPVLDTFGTTYQNLSKQATDTSIPVSQRLQNILVYVREKSLPALQHAIVDGQSPNGPSVPTPETSS
ncbi:hypothetical protein CF319_g3030 [Tilletia indica]|uniref:Lipid droplet-associated perilipin protein n=2 Tax=Tilletia TaxID=13289 RepID=A0A8X7T4U3_9BASI|nr:hypothetical protein CF327_g1200 [Tilletia walkeri]KAE8224022.1 hypothetical protein CF319_g3030 [Tilletia indica]KAE8254099.1 hypothetical protein A4X13_0g3550 [Tilletia indica]KAE8268168.1 hypothetical protein A4X09_0g4167 [Tilletia walkeri]